MKVSRETALLTLSLGLCAPISGQTPCNLSPIASPPEALWGDLRPGSLPAAGDDSTSIVGKPTVEAGSRWVDVLETGNAVWPIATVAGKGFALRQPRADGSLPGKRDSRRYVAKLLPRGWCGVDPEEMAGEADDFFSGGAVGRELGYLILASKSPAIGGLTVWTIGRAPSQVFRLEGVACAQVAAAGGFALCAAPRQAAGGGVRAVDLNQVSACDAACSTQGTCPAADLGTLGLSAVSAVTAIYEKSGLSYAASPAGRVVALYLLTDSGPARQVGTVPEPGAFALDFAIVGGRTLLATASRERLAVWHIVPGEPRRAALIWQGPRPGTGTAAVRWLAERYLWAAATDPSCDADGHVLMLDTRREYRPVGTSSYWGWWNRFRKHRPLAVELVDDDLYMAGYSSLTHHRLQSVRAEIFSDGFESGGAEKWQ